MNAAWALSFVKDEFDNSEGIDDEMLTNFLDEAGDEVDGLVCNISEDEAKFLEEVNIFSTHQDDANFEIFRSDYHDDYFVTIRRKLGQDGTVVFKANCVLDGPVDECLFTEWVKSTRQALTDAFCPESGVLSLGVKHFSRHCQENEIKKKVRKVKMRIMERLVWRKFPDGKVLVGYGSKTGAPRGEDWEFFDNFNALDTSSPVSVDFKETVELHALPPIGDVSQTKATFMVELPPHFHAAGNAANRQTLIVQRLNKISHFRKRLDRR